MATTAKADRNLVTQSDAEPSTPAAERFAVLRPSRRRLTAEETRERVRAFAAEREEALIAAVRKDED